MTLFLLLFASGTPDLVRGNLQRGLDFAAGRCGECHAVSLDAAMDEPALSAPPTFRWIARNHPQYLDGFLLRPSRGHPFVSGRDAVNLRALFMELERGG